MICNKCGAALPDNAEFCGECGAKVEKKKKAPAALVVAKAEAKRYKIISIILAGLCVILGAGWLITSNDPYDNIDKYEKDAVEVERAGIEMSGTYVVGEDSELPAGRYNLYPPDNERYMSVNIYATMEDAKAKFDKDYNSLAVDHIYSLTRGYKLKEGQIVVIDYDSAYFELVSEEVTETQAEETEPAAVDETEAAEETEGTE